ncbi:TonB-dependent siderophore receptor [Roseibium sp. CAU 1637]|uniref:TonB-dependent siderophore receptor n=1 Tax=Roseibium limicola TaxID=2816037 RepID=A0A939EN44_9HYPH|nr:TonB-dependent siderophore receptor [Roseibium limicola]MBO0345599.1 TonB-dependent siderophore receptor [Roseibium limicola]
MSNFRQNLLTFSLAASVSVLALASAQTRAQAQEIQLEKVTVNSSAETATGPVEGYVAELSRTGTKTDTPLSKTPQSISVVPTEQIEDQGAENIAEALRYTPGVYSDYRGDQTVLDEVFMRGFQYVPVFVNGLDYGTNRLGSWNSYLLERVEVLRGPSSVLYGAATPGGLVNLVTKKPTGLNKREVEILTGLDNKIGVGVDWQGTIDDAGVWSYRIVGQAQREDSEVNDIIEQGFAISPSLRWSPTADTSLTLSAMYNHEPDAGYKNFRTAAGTLFASSGGWIPADVPFSNPNVDESIVTQGQVAYEFEHRFNDMFKFRQNAAYNNIDTAFTSVLHRGVSGNLLTSGVATNRDTDLQQVVVDNQLQTDFATGALTHTLLTGADYKYTTTNYLGLFDRNVPDQDWTTSNYPAYTPNWSVQSQYEAEAQQIGLYAQDQIEIGNLNISVGGRYDWATQDYNNQSAGTTETFDESAFTGRIGAIYNFENGISPYVSYSTSFEPSFQVDSNGKPLDPTTGQQIEAGVKFAPVGGNFQVIASIFQLYQQNIASSDGINTYQTGEVRSQGVELEARAKLTDNLSVIAGYSYVDAETTKDEQAANVGLRPAMIPETMASVWGKYDFFDGALEGLGLGLGVRYIGESTTMDNVYTIKSATLLDAMASYDFSRFGNSFEGLKLQVNGSNLLDRRYVSACNTTTTCFLGQGRTVTAKLKYTW